MLPVICCVFVVVLIYSFLRIDSSFLRKHTRGSGTPAEVDLNPSRGSRPYYRGKDWQQNLSKGATIFKAIVFKPGGTHIKATTEAETETDPETGIVTEGLDIVVGIRGRAERISRIV